MIEPGTGLPATLLDQSEPGADASLRAEAGDPRIGELWKVAAGVSDDAVVGVDRSGRVRVWTASAARLFGLSTQEAEGRRADLLFTRARRYGGRSWIRSALGAARHRKVSCGARRSDGQVVPVDVTTAPLPDGDGLCLIIREMGGSSAPGGSTQDAPCVLETLDLSPIGVWSWDLRSGRIELSAGMYRLHGYEPPSSGAPMESLVQLCHPDDREVLAEHLQRAREGGRPVHAEYRCAPALQQRWVEIRATVDTGPDGTPVRMRGLCQDATDRRQAAESLRRQTALLELVQRIGLAADEATDLTDALHRCLLEVCTHLRWPVGHAALVRGGRVDGHIWHLTDRNRYARLRDRVESGTGSGLVMGGRAIDAGEPVWVTDLTPAEAAGGGSGRGCGFAFPVTVGEETLAVVELLSSDLHEWDDHLLDAARHVAIHLARVAEQERARHELAHQAMHDALTGLPNRSLFVDRLAQAVRGLRAWGSNAAVLFIDLDNFKLINDSLGHAAGDEVLKLVAARLLAALRPGDTVARFGGDEFIVLCEHLPNDEAVGDVARDLLDAVAQPMELGGDIATVVTGSIGIAIAESAEEEPEHLIRDADAATFRAKEDGRGRFHIFDAALHERATLKLSLANELRRAVDSDELRLVYQPQFRLSDGVLVGVEALARWDSPARGTLNPAEWIPVAEETQLIVPIGEWILREACRAATGWAAADTRPAGMPLKMGVNVSAVQLARPDLLDTVQDVVQTTGVEPSQLCIEITESVLMGAPGTSLETLLGMKKIGMSIAIDDFGTGYSSLAYLRRFPIDMIKIDKGFVDGLGQHDARAESIVRAVVQLAEALGVAPVAEGVERFEQVSALAEVGCYAAQGFYLGRPQTGEQIAELLRRRRADAGGAPTSRS